MHASGLALASESDPAPHGEPALPRHFPRVSQTISSLTRHRAAAGRYPGPASPRGGELTSMRKNFALAMVGLLALTLAFAAIGCGGNKSAESTPSDQSAMPSSSDTSMKAMSDSASHDTTMKAK